MSSIQDSFLSAVFSANLKSFSSLPQNQQVSIHSFCGHFFHRFWAGQNLESCFSQMTTEEKVQIQTSLLKLPVLNKRGRQKEIRKLEELRKKVEQELECQNEDNRIARTYCLIGRCLHPKLLRQSAYNQRLKSLSKATLAVFALFLAFRSLK